MAPKILTSLLLLFLLSNIFIAYAALFTILNQKDLNNYDVNNDNKNPCFVNRVFHVLPKGYRVPPSGASRRQNDLQRSSIEDDRSVRDHDHTRHDIDCKGDTIPHHGSSKCHNKFL